MPVCSAIHGHEQGFLAVERMQEIVGRAEQLIEGQSHRLKL
jgi:hypothetical protein